MAIPTKVGTQEKATLIEIKAGGGFAGPDRIYLACAAILGALFGGPGHGQLDSLVIGEFPGKTVAPGSWYGCGMKLLKAAVCTVFSLGAEQARACGVALALTVDVSGSVDTFEYQLQMGGLAQALRDGLVADALIAEKAAVMVVHWSGRSRQSVVVPWTRVETVADADALARAVEQVPRAWRNYSTGIGEALAFTANQFGPVSDCDRFVIDVSGDGISNEGAPPEDIKDVLAGAGFTINGLAIEGETANLTEYYRQHVIAGPNAFVLPSFGFDDYPTKIRKKLIREVTKQVAAK